MSIVIILLRNFSILLKIIIDLQFLKFLKLLFFGNKDILYNIINFGNKDIVQRFIRTQIINILSLIILNRSHKSTRNFSKVFFFVTVNFCS